MRALLVHFKKAVDAPHGMILVTGPTGSGKTTTLYSVLAELNNPEYNIVTVEDPIEYQVPGINQVAVKSEIGLTFAESLRSILRQDPDIVMIGEIRDNETADIAVKAALTGHQVLSTLHTNDAQARSAGWMTWALSRFSSRRRVSSLAPSDWFGGSVPTAKKSTFLRTSCSRSCRLRISKARSFFGERVAIDARSAAIRAGRPSSRFFP
jgi:energy-coupling factor transporter ATP-binding protein EcfA2